MARGLQVWPSLSGYNAIVSLEVVSMVTNKQANELREVFRCQEVTQQLCDMLALGCRAEAEIFEGAYGDPRGRQYWGALLSEPVRVYKLAATLAIHVAEGAEQLDVARIAIIRALRDAAAAGVQWFVGDTSPLFTLKDGHDFANLIALKVHPRAAIEWLLGKPKRKHLVPDSLRIFLQSVGAPVVAVQPLTQNEAKLFATRYVNDAIAAGRRPTLVGLEAAARQAGIHGGRDHLRAAFHRSIDVRRGRPTKS
jgi:hypothetical protein